MYTLTHFLLLSDIHIAMRFGSLYDAGDNSVQQDIIEFATTTLLNSPPSNITEPSEHQTLACLAQRIPLEFYSVTYNSQAREREQVERHMRVYLKVDSNFESMVTMSPSEPLLSEAAYGIMTRPSFNVPKAMKSVINGFSIHKGDRGEFLVMLLFTIARDKVVGPPNRHGAPITRIVNVAEFLNEGLFRNPIPHLSEDFPDANMHFNHYIKVHEAAVIGSQYLLLLLSRGAGLLCANSQLAIDGINPFLSKGTELGYENLGLILWQSKNDPAFTDKPQQELFDAMDVYKLKVLKKHDAAIPLIKIIFALAAEKPSCIVNRVAASPSCYNAIVYQVWCAGITSDKLNAVEPSEEPLWLALLQASYGWHTIYEGELVEQELRRSMNPGAATDNSHWTRWANIDDG